MPDQSVIQAKLADLIKAIDAERNAATIAADKSGIVAAREQDVTNATGAMAMAQGNLGTAQNDETAALGDVDAAATVVDGALADLRTAVMS